MGLDLKFLAGLIARQRQLVIVAGQKQSNTGPIEIGSAPFDPAWFIVDTFSLTFVVYACGGSLTQQVKLDLVNKKTGATIASVTTATGVTVPTEYASVAISVPSISLPAARTPLGVVMTPLVDTTSLAQCTYAALEIST